MPPAWQPRDGHGSTKQRIRHHCIWDTQHAHESKAQTIRTTVCICIAGNSAHLVNEFGRSQHIG